MGIRSCYGILSSLRDRPVAHPGVFVGLKNFATDVNDTIFWKLAFNTVFYTAVRRDRYKSAGILFPGGREYTAKNAPPGRLGTHPVPASH